MAPCRASWPYPHSGCTHSPASAPGYEGPCYLKQVPLFFWVKLAKNRIISVYFLNKRIIFVRPAVRRPAEPPSQALPQLFCRHTRLAPEGPAQEADTG